MQKLWRRDYNFNVNKDQLSLSRFYKNSLLSHLSQLPMM